MRLPTIHINGTSAKQLLEDHCDAAHHVREALAALARCAPNGRDHYPQGPDAIQDAQREHMARADKLRAVLADLEKIAEHIADQTL